MADADDPRVTAARPDLAAASLKGKVEAARFVAGEPRVVIETTAPLIAYYERQGIVRRVSAEQPIADVSAEIRRVLDEAD